MFDVLISGGTVVDGSGAPGFRADVGIEGDSIEAVGDLSSAGARRVVDATGLAVSPGFIDTHAHSDGILLWDPQHANGLRQGITTEILGQDGLSYAPLSAENYATYRRYLSGILGEPPEGLDMSSVAAFRSHYDRKVSINTAYCVAHGAVRLEALGFDDEPLTGAALEKAKRLIKEGIEQGAVGFATGLAYFPHSWSDTREMVELCTATREAGGVYVTHLRSNHNERSFGGAGGVPRSAGDRQTVGRRRPFLALPHRSWQPGAGRGEDGAHRQGQGRGRRLHAGAIPLPVRMHLRPQHAAELHARRRPRRGAGEAPRPLGETEARRSLR